MNNDRITDESLFKFMSIMTRKVPSLEKNPTDLLGLHQVEKDMFLELFSPDFCKIQAALRIKQS